MTAAMLFLAKLLSFLLVVLSGDAARYGGALRLGLSALLEILLSTLLAPIRMWFHSKYVFLTLLGREIKWGTQRRDGAETGWLEALRQHCVLTVAGLAWTAGLLWLNPSLAGWVLPVTVPMSLAIPLSVFSSRAALGIFLRRWRLLLIPEETDPPEVIRKLQTLCARRARAEQAGGSVKGALATMPRAGFARGNSPQSGVTQPHIRSRDKLATKGAGKVPETTIAQVLFDGDDTSAPHRRVERIERSGKQAEKPDGSFESPAAKAKMAKSEQELAIHPGANPRANNTDDFI
jgi:membrane glycosyltransferase